jgi:radical SAM superfamily enzyme YgiQ (UPF0313 family)
MMKIAVIGDSWGFGLLETRPFPLWQRRFAALRNKALLVPDYGAMYVTSFIKANLPACDDLRVINLIADIFGEESLYLDRTTGDGEEETDCPISDTSRMEEARSYLRDALLDYQPDVVLFPLSIYYIALHARRMLARVREILPEATIITGGVYATLHPQEILADGAADCVVRGEGEWTLKETLDALKRGGNSLAGVAGLSWRRDGEIRHNPDREREREIDRFPHIYTVSEEFRIGLRHRLLKRLNPFEDYIPGAGILTSRGCPEECTFCLDPAVWKRITRFHSPEYVREVVDFCFEHFTEGERSFYFGDATFALNRKRLFKLLDRIEGVPYSYNIQTRADSLTPAVLARLRELDFASVAIGAESLNDRILHEVVKKRTTREEILGAARAVKASGIRPILTFIVGLPGESRESIEETLELVRREGIYDAVFFPLVVFRGTGLYHHLLENFSEEEREKLRLNPFSEEYCLASEEFPTIQSLIDFADDLNTRVKQP